MSDANNIYNLYMEQYSMAGELQSKLKEIESKIASYLPSGENFGETGSPAARAKLEVYDDMIKWLEAMIINYD
jgi:hypothetical protein